MESKICLIQRLQLVNYFIGSLQIKWVSKKKLHIIEVIC